MHEDEFKGQTIIMSLSDSGYVVFRFAQKMSISYGHSLLMPLDYASSKTFTIFHHIRVIFECRLLSVLLTYLAVMSCVVSILRTDQSSGEIDFPLFPGIDV